MTARLLRNLAGLALWAITAATFLFLLLPLVVVVPQSFSASSLWQLPPAVLSVRWYQEFFHDPFWTDSLRISLLLGAATALVATLLSFGAAIAMRRQPGSVRKLVRAIMLTPMITPIIVSAMALLEATSRLGLFATFPGLLITHVVIALPLPFIVVENSLRSLDPSLEEAAVTLGLPQWRVTLQVTAPLIAGGLLTGAAFAFITSWDEVLLAQLIGGVDNQTLPARMMEFLTTQVRPTVAAVSTLLIAAMLATLSAASLFGILQRHLRMTRRRSSI